MSFFVEGQKGKDKSFQMCAGAIQQVYSLGLHQAGHPKHSGEQYAATLLCCVWSLDRLNAVFHGKPVLMHERDFGIDLNAYIQAQEPCFQLFLRIMTVLDKVIDLYRPGNGSPKSWEQEFPSFEGLIANANACHVSQKLLGKSLRSPRV